VSAIEAFSPNNAEPARHIQLYPKAGVMPWVSLEIFLKVVQNVEDGLIPEKPSPENNVQYIIQEKGFQK